MKKMTLKEIKNYVNNGVATDLATLTSEEINNLSKKYIEKVGYSIGVYGLDGGMFEDYDGNLYAIVGRTSNLFKFF